MASEIYKIPKKRIADELSTSGRLIRYYVSTFPHELKINMEFRNIMKEINEHPELNKEYFDKKCLNAFNENPLWNVWIEDHRFLCQIGNLIIDPDMNKVKSEILFRRKISWVLWDLIDLQDDLKIEMVIKIVNDGKEG